MFNRQQQRKMIFITSLSQTVEKFRLTLTQHRLECCWLLDLIVVWVNLLTVYVCVCVRSVRLSVIHIAIELDTFDSDLMANKTGDRRHHHQFHQQKHNRQCQHKLSARSFVK